MRQFLFVLFVLFAGPVYAQNTVQHNGTTYAVEQPHTSYLRPGRYEPKLGYGCVVTFEGWTRVTTCTWQAVARVTNDGAELGEGGSTIAKQDTLLPSLGVLSVVVLFLGGLIWETRRVY